MANAQPEYYSSTRPRPEPPVEVVLGWICNALNQATTKPAILDLLHWYYDLSGQWPTAPDRSSKSPTTDSNNVSHNINSSAAIREYYQPPMPGIAGPVPVGNPVPSSPQRRKWRTTRYDYWSDNEYNREAGRLLALQSPALASNSGCRATLALILAWCNSLLFSTGADRKGRWMTLGARRMARELGIQNIRLYDHLNLLEEYGLIEIGTLQSGIISFAEFETLRRDGSQLKSQLEPTNPYKEYLARALQTSSVFYRIRNGVEVFPLPEFKPFSFETGFSRQLYISETPGQSQLELLESTSGTPSVLQKHLDFSQRVSQSETPRAGNGSETATTYPPRVMTHESHDDEDEKASTFDITYGAERAENTHNQPDVTENNKNKHTPLHVLDPQTGLGSPVALLRNTIDNLFEQQVSLLPPDKQQAFLSLVKLEIPGYSGRSMDELEAYNLVLAYPSGHIDQSIKTLMTLLSQGKPIDRPVAYLHTIITRGIEPDGLPDPTLQTVLAQNRVRNRKMSSPRRVSGSSRASTGAGWVDASSSVAVVTAEDSLEPIIHNSHSDNVETGYHVEFKIYRVLSQIDKTKADLLQHCAIEGNHLILKFSGQPREPHPDWLRNLQIYFPHLTAIEVLR